MPFRRRRFFHDYRGSLHRVRSVRFDVRPSASCAAVDRLEILAAHGRDQVMDYYVRHRLRYIILALVIIGAGLGYVAYEKLLARDIPIYTDDEEHFKYGSIGND